MVSIYLAYNKQQTDIIGQIKKNYVIIYISKFYMLWSALSKMRALSSDHFRHVKTKVPVISSVQFRTSGFS
jgi:hypothetical protein